jgi:hypothetical protein
LHRQFDQAEAGLKKLDALPDPYGYMCVSTAGMLSDQGDHLLNSDRDIAIWFYTHSLAFYRLFASWSTSGGEGTARMVDVHATEAKLKRAQSGQ